MLNMNHCTEILKVLGLLMMWNDIEQVKGGHTQLSSSIKYSGERLERQINSGNQMQPPPAPGPAGYVYKVPNCNCQATSQFYPVCGSNGVTYQNSQLLQCAASCGENVTLRRPGPCGRGLASVRERPSTN